MTSSEALPTDLFSEGERCSALLDTPAGHGPWPGVVLCAGLRGVKEWLLPGLAEAYRRSGFAVLRFDYRGSGASDGRRGHLTPARQVEDIRAAVAFLGTRSGVDSARITVHGVGMGGGHAVTAAASDQGIAAVVAQACIGNVRRAWFEPMEPGRRAALVRRLHEDRDARAVHGRSGELDPGELLDNEQSRAAFAAAAATMPGLGVRFTIEAVERVLEYEPERCAALIAPRPLLVIGAARDLAAPVEESRRLFAAAAPPRRLEILPAAHYELFASPWCDRVVELASAWCGDHLAARTLLSV